MRTKADTRLIVERLKKEYPVSECSLAYDDAWQLLVSVRLSAQCTDARVNIVTKDLFAKYPTLEALAAAGPDAIEAIIKPCGLGKSKACFATLAERKTRFYIAVKIPDRRAETMENAIVSVLSAFPPQLVKTITCDRGAEFANWRRIEERLHCDV